MQSCQVVSRISRIAAPAFKRASKRASFGNSTFCREKGRERVARISRRRQFVFCERGYEDQRLALLILPDTQQSYRSNRIDAETVRDPGSMSLDRVGRQQSTTIQVRRKIRGRPPGTSAALMQKQHESSISRMHARERNRQLHHIDQNPEISSTRAMNRYPVSRTVTYWSRQYRFTFDPRQCLSVFWYVNPCEPTSFHFLASLSPFSFSQKSFSFSDKVPSSSFTIRILSR